MTAGSRSVHDPAPAPLWRDPRSAHHLITLDHLLRMRSGLGFPVLHDDGRVTPRLREQRGLPGRRRRVRCSAALHGCHRARARCSATSTAASTCWARSSATGSRGAACRTTRPCMGCSPTGIGMTQLPALRRYHRQPHRLRRRLRHAARLRQAGRAVCAGRRVGRRAAAAGRLGRLRADRDPHRHQLRRLLPHQRRPAVPRPAGGYRLGVRRIRPAHLHPAPPAADRRGGERDRPHDGPGGARSAGRLRRSGRCSRAAAGPAGAVGGRVRAAAGARS